MTGPGEQSLVPFEAVTALAHGRVLVFAPHPDDEVFGCGGAIARHVIDGDPVSVIVVTDGGFTGDTPADADGYIAQREAESRSAAAGLGYGEPVFWRLPDRGLEYGERLVTRLAEAIEEAGADLVYAPSIYEMHPDHRALGMCAVEAVRRRKRDTTLAMYEVATPIRPNRLLDITPVVAVKARAMSAFRSQLQRQTYDRHITALNVFRTYTLPASVEAAEAYLVLRAEELRGRWSELYASEVERHRASGVDLDAGSAALVSVVVRGASPPSALRRTLDAIALQTHPRLEVIVLRPAGSEAAEQGRWCGRFPLREVECASGANAAAMANAGLESAGGDFLALLQPGDVLAPEHAAALVEVLAAHGGPAVAVAADAAWGDGAKPRQPDPVGDLPPTARLLCGSRLPLAAALIARALIADDGLRFDETLREVEDWAFWLQLAARATLLPRRDIAVVAGARTRVHHGGEGGAGHDSEWQAVRNRWQGHWNVEHLHDVLADYDQRIDESVGALRRSLEAEQSRRAAAEQALESAVEQQRRLSAELEQVLGSRSWRAMSFARHGSSALRRVLHRLGRGSQLSH